MVFFFFSRSNTGIVWLEKLRHLKGIFMRSPAYQAFYRRERCSGGQSNWGGLTLSQHHSRGCRGFVMAPLTWPTWRPYQDPITTNTNKFVCFLLLYSKEYNTCVSSFFVSQRRLQNLKKNQSNEQTAGFVRLFWVQVFWEQQGWVPASLSIMWSPSQPDKDPSYPACHGCERAGGHSGGPEEDLWDPTVLFSYEKGITNKLLRAST